ncbi:MAG: hypothetical protein ACT4OF_13780 [Caulobacteraceae bacterium]
MRILIRGALIGLVLSVAALSACQRQSSKSEESASTPTNAEREAEIAAETLAALGGPANAQQRALYEGDFQASGGIDALGNAEGAWELTLLEDYAQFARPGLGEDGGIPGDRDYREGGMRVVAGPLTITISQQPCTASGVELPYTAHVLFEGVAYQGCARRGVIEGERPTWASVLPELIPAIDTCLARATSRPARVTFASALDEGEVSVRIREANGTRHECIASGGAVAVYEPLSDVDRRPGEGDPEFQRGGSQPGARNCRTVESAIDRTGAELGWLIRSSC